MSQVPPSGMLVAAAVAAAVVAAGQLVSTFIM